MKIAIVNFNESKGGAAMASKRLFNALNKENINVKYFVQFKESNDDKIIGQNHTLFKKIYAKILTKYDEFKLRKYKKDPFSLFSLGIVGNQNIIKSINKYEPDIVHIHWINAGMLSIKQIKQINAPIVWSMHDMWPFTGGCHYSKKCLKYYQKCNKCPILNSNNEDDLSSVVFNQKIELYSKNNISFIGLSKWIMNEAKKSALLKNQIIANLPNPINIKEFYNFDTKKARIQLGLPLDKKLILFGAVGAESDPRKGFVFLKKALNVINIDAELVIFGSNNKTNYYNFKIHHLGLISNVKMLNLIYNSVDVIIVPSIQENLSNIIVESIATGTPVVCFDIGGNRDIISHNKTGYLASPFDYKDLANGIVKMIYSDKKLIKEHCLNTIMSKFESQKVAKEYIQFYKTIIKTWKTRSLP